MRTTEYFSLRAKRWIARVGTSVCCVAAAALPYDALAGFSCWGKVGQLGVDSATGEVLVGVIGSTPIHKICSMVNQGSYVSTVQSCKAIYAGLMAAKLSDRNVNLFYQDATGGCGQIVPWSIVPSMYFAELPI